MNAGRIFEELRDMLGYDSIIEPGTDPGTSGMTSRWPWTLAHPESDPDSEANLGATCLKSTSERSPVCAR